MIDDRKKTNKYRRWGMTALVVTALLTAGLISTAFAFVHVA